MSLRSPWCALSRIPGLSRFSGTAVSSGNSSGEVSSSDRLKDRLWCKSPRNQLLSVSRTFSHTPPVVHLYLVIRFVASAVPHPSMQVTAHPSISAATASSSSPIPTQATSPTTHYAPYYAPQSHHQYYSTNAYGSGVSSYHARYEIPTHQPMTQIPHGYAAFYSQPAYGQPVSNNNTAHQGQEWRSATMAAATPWRGA